MTTPEEPTFIDPDEFEDYDDVDSTSVVGLDDTYEPPTDDIEGCEDV